MSTEAWRRERAVAEPSAALLAERARHEQRRLADILTRHDQLAIVPWQAVAPTGTDALLSMLGAADTVRA